MMTETLQTYAEFRPTALDSHINIDAGEDSREHWLIVPVSQTRDSGALAKTNFAAALQSLGGESETVEVHRFGHWGPGWFDIMLVDPADAERVRIAEDIARRLEDYPVLDESALSEAEYEEARQSWDDWGADDAARGVSRDIGIGAAATDRLAEFFASDAGWQWWLENNNAPYEPDGSGTSFPGLFRCCSGGRARPADRDKCATLLQTVRHWEQTKIRDCECLECGHKWEESPELSEHTGNLSGERSIYCPACETRSVMAGPLHSRR